MVSGQIVIQDEQVGSIRKVLAGSLTNDGFLMLDRMEDTNDRRKMVAGITLNPQEAQEFYKQLKVLMEG